MSTFYIEVSKMKLMKQRSRLAGDKEYFRWMVTIPPAYVNGLGWSDGLELESYLFPNLLILTPRGTIGKEGNPLQKYSKSGFALDPSRIRELTNEQLFLTYNLHMGYASNLYSEVTRRGLISKYLRSLKEETVRPPTGVEGILRLPAGRSPTAKKETEEVESQERMINEFFEKNPKARDFLLDAAKEYGWPKMVELLQTSQKRGDKKD